MTLQVSLLIAGVVSVVSTASAQTASTEVERRVFGRDIYLKACSACHGEEGRGDGPAAAYVDPKPRNFVRGRFKFRTTDYGSKPTDEDLRRTIREGIPGTSMPAWDRQLSDEELEAVVAFLKTFAPEVFEEELDEDEEIVVPEQVPPFTEARRREGRALYILMQCWRCHGTDGKGDGPSSETLKDSWGDPIEAYDFTTGVFKSGHTPRDLFRTFSVGLAGTPMPAYKDAVVLPREIGDDLSRFRDTFSETELQAVRDVASAWPSMEALSGLGETELAEMSVDRRWSLTAYIWSLAEGSGVRRYLANPYVTPRRSLAGD